MEMGEWDVEDAERDQPRTPQAVARRCLVLYALIAAGHGAARDKLVHWLREEGLWESVSPREAAFLQSESPERAQTIAATWRAEALFPLIWALGGFQKLPPPTGQCDLSVIMAALPPLLASTAQFISQAVLRESGEIMEANEDVYQANWAVRDAKINNKPIPNGSDPEVIEERHHALNWLIGYGNQDWDDVATDT